MGKIQTIHGSITSIIIYAQIRKGIPYINHYLNNSNNPNPLPMDKMIDPKQPLLFYVNFGNMKAFIDQMSFNEGALLGMKMKELYTSLKLK